MAIKEHFKKINTLCVHGGNDPDEITGAVNVPIVTATTFKQYLPGKAQKFVYSRANNPTRNCVEKAIGKLENGQFCTSFASGSAATTMVAHVLSPGDHVLSANDIYGGTIRFFENVMKPKYNISTEYADFQETEKVIKIIKDKKPNALWMETPSNPILKIIDLEPIISAANKSGVLVVVDNTFASPYLQVFSQNLKNPLKFGADIVLHSASKFINGHSDVIMGFVVTNNKEIADKIKYLQNTIGAIPSPSDCYNTLRGIKTLHVRMERACNNAMQIAEFLDAHPKILKVYYPGLKSHPNHSVATRQMRFYGAVVSFEINGGRKEAFSFLANLNGIVLAESLGSVETLINYPMMMSHGAVSNEMKNSMSINDGLIRLSAGIEDVEDILGDLEFALEHLK